MFRIKYEVSSLIKILDSSEAQPRPMYNVLINGIDRVLKPTKFTVHY